MSPAVLLGRVLDLLPNGVVVAVLSIAQLKEIAIGVAAIITLLGVRLCWEAPHNRMSIEERAKDGKLTEEQARRKISRLAWFGPLVTFAGVALLCGVLVR
jgi:hypothetical protein